MAKFRHHKHFSKTKALQLRRHSFVCFACRKSFKFPVSVDARLCPQCRSPMEMLGRKFAAPASKDVGQWRKVKYLVDHGLRFYKVYRDREAVRYPATLEEARLFVDELKRTP